MKKLILMISLLICICAISAACEGESEKSQPPGGPEGTQESGQSPGQSPAAAIQPKQLISKEDAAKLLGEPLKEGVESKDLYQGISSCFYAPEKSDSKSYLLIALLQKASGGQQSGGSSAGQQSGGQQSGGLEPKKVYEILKKIFADPNTPVGGFIGDDKFIISQGMCILNGENCIFVSVGNADPVKALEMQKQAAELAVTNINRIQGK